MARRRGGKSAKGLGLIIFLIIGAVSAAIEAVISFISNNKDIFILIGGVILFAVIVILVTKSIITIQRDKLHQEIFSTLHLYNVNYILTEYDDRIMVKSRQALDNYSDLKYFKEKNNFEDVKLISESRKKIRNSIMSFLKENDYKKRNQYDYVRKELEHYMKMADGYRVKVVYITSAGNKRGERIIPITASRIDEIRLHPEILMSKTEYNKYIKNQAKQELDAQKHLYYERVNKDVCFANELKKTLIVKSQTKKLDELADKLFYGTVNSIQNIKSVDSDEWGVIEIFISSIEKEIEQIVQDDKRISDYYASEEFAAIKQTCKMLTQSQKEFNEYIGEKTQSIMKLFGIRVVRNETRNEDVYNYNRIYKKNINPFVAEVSSAVFGSAENNPIGYVVKYFYPNKSQYKVQIEKLRILIEELETLKEAKVIIDNYKKDYEKYIQDVPEYVLKNDNDGFYSRLGLAIIDEAVLNVEYKFTYTSDGGMAQRSFTIPMNEENITELIIHLESKLSLENLAKEQRALMTAKLRTKIKERDNYTCCECGNSIHSEPNLLLEIDHIKPISKGGLTQEDNLQTLCWKCNRRKGSKLIVF